MFICWGSHGFPCRCGLQRHGHTDVVAAWHQGILPRQLLLLPLLPPLLLPLGNAFGCGVAALLEKVKRQLATQDSGILHETPLLLVVLMFGAAMYASRTHGCDDTWISSGYMMVPGMAAAAGLAAGAALAGARCPHVVAKQQPPCQRRPAG